MNKVLISLVLFFDACGAFAQAGSEEVAHKAALSQAYLAKDSFNYTFSGVYQGQRFNFGRVMRPQAGYAQFSSNDPCYSGSLKAEFHVDQATGDIVAMVMPARPFCGRTEYRFDPVTKKGSRIMFDAKSNQAVPDDSSYTFTLQ